MTKGEIALIIFEVVSNFTSQTSESIAEDFFPLLNNIIFLTPESLGFVKSGALNGKMEKYGDILLFISNAFILAVLLWYCIKSVFSHYFPETKVENTGQFLMKIILIGILMNNSYFLSYQAVYFTSELTNGIRDTIEDEIISFKEFGGEIEKETEEISENEEEISVFTVDGIISVFIHFGTFILGVVYIARYIVIELLILFSPVAFLLCMNESTKRVFTIWIRMILGLLALQIIASFTLVIPGISNFEEDLITQIMLCGVIIVLIKINSMVYKAAVSINSN